MAFQTPITIKAALDAIQRQEYVLPAIQREFEWSTDRIRSLFDSLMQGYPIGSFLFWKVQPEHSTKYAWYGFLKDYHQKKNRHLPVLDLPAKPLTAILDGQQRLTSLNIGLRGSHAEKEPRKWWDNPDAFPQKFLYLNLLSLAAPNELGHKYDFRFLTPERAEATQDSETFWFPVAQVATFEKSFDVIRALQKVGLGNNEEATDRLHRLYEVIHRDGNVPHYVEEEQDLDKVLNIFIRMNSGGVPLSYSDLLLSIATAQWKELDARQEIHGLVDELNNTGHGFSITKDLVLKAGLMLSDLPSVAFRVTNFNATNMKTLESNWPHIARALRAAIELLADFGFSRQTLSADSVAIPVAYYLYRHKLTDKYRDSVSYQQDRENLRAWICRTLVKSGVWGSGLDSTLIAIRDVIRDEGEGGFPSTAIDAALSKRGKVMRFTEEEIQDLLDSSYNDRRTFPLLALLYDFVNLRNVFHIDHVFPQSSFTPRRLRNAGIAEDRINVFREKSNQLANLQLLEGPSNMSKKDLPPAEWLERIFDNEHKRENYCRLHDLGSVPGAVLEFDTFFNQRRERLEKNLRTLLGVSEVSA